MKPRLSIGQYFAMGPAAVKAHSAELDVASEIHSKSVVSPGRMRDCLRAVGLSKVTPKIRGLLRILTTHTLAEIDSERRALRAILGGNQRVWEV